MNAATNETCSEPIGAVLHGRIVDCEPRTEPAGRCMIGTLRTSGSYGSLLRFRVSCEHAIIQEAFRINAEIRMTGRIEDGLLQSDEAIRITENSI